MRYGWIGYAVALIITLAMVGTSIILPGEFLRRQQGSLIGKVTAVEDSSRLNTNKPSNLNKQDSVEELYKKVRMLTPNNPQEIKPQEPSGNEMSMKEAVIEGEKQLTLLVSNGVLPEDVLDYTGFKVSAKLGTIGNFENGFIFSFWSINYTSVTDKSIRDGSLSIIVDAETGKIYSIQWFSKNLKHDLNSLETGIAFAKYLNIQAKPGKVSPKGNYAALISPDSRFLIIVNYIKPSDFGLQISVEASGRDDTLKLRK
jgi:hypothetical protein